MNLLTPAETAKRLGLNTQTVLRAIRRGDLEAVQPKGVRRYYISEEALREWMVPAPRNTDPGVLKPDPPKAKVAPSSFTRRLQAIESNTEAE